MAKLEELEEYTTPKIGTALQWYGSFSMEDQAMLRQVILNNASTTVLEPLQNNADFPFGLTTLKDLRAKLRKGNV